MTKRFLKIFLTAFGLNFSLAQAAPVADSNKKEVSQATKVQKNKTNEQTDAEFDNLLKQITDGTFEFEDDRPIQQPKQVIQQAIPKLPQSKPCSSCQTTAPRPKPRQLRPSCDDQLPTLVSKASLLEPVKTPSTEPSMVPFACMQELIKKNIPSADYLYCQPNQKIFSKDTFVDTNPFCHSKAYAQLMHDSFHLASHCLIGPLFGQDRAEINTKLFYAVFAHESHFHLNAFSFSRAGGVAQLTPNAIRDFNNDRDGNPAKAVLNKSPDPRCKALAKLPKLSPLNICDRVATQKGNPLNSFVYAYNLAALNRTAIAKTLRANQKSFRSIISESEGKNVYKIFETSLVMWAHNVGGGRLNGALAKVLKKSTDLNFDDLNEYSAKFWQDLREQVAKDEYDDLIQQAKSALKPKQKIPSFTMKRIEARVDEAARYLSKVFDTLDDLKKIKGCTL
jgi:hypothetical protein